jgi:hypothetical protein
MLDDSWAGFGRIVLFRQSPRGSGSSGLAVPIGVDARGERFLMDEGNVAGRRHLYRRRRTVGRIAVSRAIRSGSWRLFLGEQALLETATLRLPRQQIQGSVRRRPSGSPS